MAKALLDEGTPISLDSVAKAAGITKPGLMYHFPTKAALMDALVDHIVDKFERELVAQLPDSASPSARDRLRAYVRWAFQGTHGPSDLVAFTDPRLADRLRQRWTARFEKWIEVPADASPQDRAALHAARLLADGSWFADATATFPLNPTDRTAVLDVALHLLEGSV